MGWLEGVLTGYADRHYEIERQKREEAALAAEREGQVFNTLLNSEYPEIRDLAGAGILDLANPRRKRGGLAGWMGELEQTPYLAAIQRARAQIESDPEYADRQLGRTGPEQGGRPPVTPSIPTPAGQTAASGSAALPSTAVTTGGPMNPPAPPPQATPSGDGMTDPRLTSQLPLGGGPPAPASPQASAAPPQPPSPYSTWAKFSQGFYPDQYGRGPGFDPGYAAASPQGYGQPQGAPQAPQAAQAPPQAPGAPQAAPQAPGAPPAMQGATNPALTQQALPAGPPLQIPQGPPPRPAGLVADGQPGATTMPAGRPAAPPRSRTDLINPRPGIFPTAASTLRQRESAEVMGQVEGWQTLYRQLGDPDWQQKGIQAVLDQKRRGAGGGMLKEGNPVQQRDGTWRQELYDPYTGQVVTSISVAAPPGGAPSTIEGVAFRRYGRQGELPRATLARLTPTQYAQVMDELRDEKALTSAEAALKRAEYMADAPLSAQSKNQLIEALNSKWTKLQAPIRETERQFNAMQVGLRNFLAAPETDVNSRASAAEMIRVAFERILDPTSVVREGEYARQVDGLALTSRMEGYIQNLLRGGGTIPEGEIKGMVESARQFMETLQGWNDVERGRIEDRAAMNGVDPGFIFGGGVRQPPPPPPTTTAGATPRISASGSTGGTSSGRVSLDTTYEMDPATGRRRIVQR